MTEHYPTPEREPQPPTVEDLATQLAQLRERTGEWPGGELVTVVEAYLTANGWDVEATGWAQRLPEAGSQG